MSGLPNNVTPEPNTNDLSDTVDVREHGNSLRVATNTPHLISLGTGRLSTAVTIHPIKQGRVTIGSDASCDINVQGTGVTKQHCKVENSHGVVTLYPVNGTTLLDGVPVVEPIRLSQDFQPECQNVQHYQNDTKLTKELNQLEQELDESISRTTMKKPPVAPRKTYKDLDLNSDSNSDQESIKSQKNQKSSNIMAKVSKFEYYAKSQQKNVNKSQFNTNDSVCYSPKVFSANSLTVNAPAKDVLGGRAMPMNYTKNMNKNPKLVILNENNAIEAKNCSYANVIVKNPVSKIDNIVRNFNEKIRSGDEAIAKPVKFCKPSPSYDRNPNYCQSYVNSSQVERELEAVNQRLQAHQERVKDEEERDVENARLEEIINICSEYEKQVTTGSGSPLTPTDRRQHNKIITNGSLPRSIGLCNPNFVQTSDGFYRFETSQNKMNIKQVQKHISQYENIELKQKNYEENTDITSKTQNATKHFPITELSSPTLIRKVGRNTQNQQSDNEKYEMTSPYENIPYNGRNLNPKSPGGAQSPRTRIKTIPTGKTSQYFIFPTPLPQESSKELEFPYQNDKNNIDNDNIGIEKRLSLNEEIPMIDDTEVMNDVDCRKSFVESDIKLQEGFTEVAVEMNSESEVNNEIVDEKDENMIEFEKLKDERRQLLYVINEMKLKMTDIRSQEDEILRELEMEKALIKGEYDSEIAILNLELNKKNTLIDKMKALNEKASEMKCEQLMKQKEIEERLEIASSKVQKIESEIKENLTSEEELQNAKDILENERKLYEDLEFQHLEDETELLSQKEDLQNEITKLTSKIEAQKKRILTLKSEASQNLNSALDETKKLQAKYVEILNQVEEKTSKVQNLTKKIKLLGEILDIRPVSPDSDKCNLTPSTENDEITNYEVHSNELKRKLNSVDQMSQSMIADFNDKRDLGDLIDDLTIHSGAKKEKKGFWERNFDSLSRLKHRKTKNNDIMSQSLNENLIYNNLIETTDDLKHNSNRNKPQNHSTPKPSKIPTFAALGKIIRKDSFTRKPKYQKNTKSPGTDNKYSNKAKQNSPEIDPKIDRLKVTIEVRKSLGDDLENSISEPTRVPSQDDIDRISKVTLDAPIFSGENDMNSLDRKTLDSLKEIERNRLALLEEQGSQVLESEREKILELKRRVQNETKKRWERDRRNDKDNPERNTTDNNSRTKEENCNETKQNYTNSRETNTCVDNPNNSITNVCSSRTSQNGSSFKKQPGSIKNESKSREDNSSVNDSSDKTSGCDSEHLPNESVNSDVRNDSDIFMTNESSIQEEDSLVNNTDSNIEMDCTGDMSSSLIGDYDSTGVMSSIEELQTRPSRPDSLASSAILEDEKRSNHRPLSDSSDISNDQLLSQFSSVHRRSRNNSNRSVNRSDIQRPLTRYLPIDRDDLDLRLHIESAGHQVDTCPHVILNSTSCRGYLHKLGAKFHTWSKRWFVFDRVSKTFIYYSDKSEKKPRGGAYFQVIEEVYLDHGNTSKSPNPQTTFVVKTRQRRYYLMSPSGQTARIWIDVIFTGAQGYTNYLE